jgi:hypothetical protein
MAVSDNDMNVWAYVQEGIQNSYLISKFFIEAKYDNNDDTNRCLKLAII